MAKIREEDIDALRERADIVEIVSGYTQLKKASGQTFKGLCPFHTEKTASFTVNAASGLFHCFGCQEGGNLYQFVQKIENLPFPQAVEWVARKVGFDLRYEEMRPGEQQAHGMKRKLIEMNAAAASFFHETLMKSPDASDARRYLGGRGFDRAVAERWQLGYAPGRDALCRHLSTKGYSPVDIVKADLGRKSDRDGSLFDAFRQRITFPTWDINGDVIAFGARALGDQQPKYLNTAETQIFSKSRVMYGLNRAKSAIGRGAAALVVEGYTDVIALHEEGITEAVATNGVALGETHFELLKKFCQRAVLMFDADAAGKGATERGFGIHHRLGLEVLVAPLPPGRDPADVVKEEGAEGIRKVIGAAQPLLEFKLEQTLAKLPLDTPEARSRAVREVVQVLGWHPDPIARGQYVFMAADRIGVDSAAIERAFTEPRFDDGEPAEGTTGRDRDRRLPGHVKVEREALQLLLNRTRDAVQWAEGVDETFFTNPARREVFRKALAGATTDKPVTPAELAQGLDAEALSLFTELSVGARDSDQTAADASEVFARLRVFRLERDIKSRRSTLQEMNPLKEPETHDALFTDLVGLEAERRDLLRKLQGAL
ncbi:MAG: DNA primase [Actinomycetota bacterium]|nr:DNA primase [Actinomycetota bacterium]